MHNSLKRIVSINPRVLPGNYDDKPREQCVRCDRVLLKQNEES